MRRSAMARSKSSTSKARRSAARARRRRLRRRGQGAPPLGGGQGAAGGQARRHRTRPRPAPTCAAAARSRTSRRAPATPARARSARRTTWAAARSSDRSRATTRTRCPRRCKRAALRSALSLRAKEKKLVVARQASVRRAQDQAAWPGSSRRSAWPRRCIVDGKENAKLFKSARNLPKAKYLPPEGLNVYDILEPRRPWSSPTGAVKQIERASAPAARPAAKETPCVHPSRSSSARCSPRRAPASGRPAATPRRPSTREA